MTTPILHAGEKLFVVSRRYFDSDTRRHFVGEVEACTDSSVRTSGYVFIMGPNNAFERKPEKRTRVFSLTDGRIMIHVIPPKVSLDKVHYVTQDERLYLTDDENFFYDVDEFRRV